ncbi:hypothetical protein ACB092_11G141800 [Castanea dentata]
MDATQRRLSLLMLLWLAHGHISPFLELSKKLSHIFFQIWLSTIFLQPWAPSIAYTHNISVVNFITTGVAMTCFALHAMKNPGEDFPFPKLHLHDYMKVSFARSSNIVLIKTFRELGGKYIDLLSSLIERKVVPVGPLVEDPVHEDEKAKTIDWLDKKKGSSTVFVSLGSEYFLSKEEMEEIAHGLELSKVDIKWVVRFPLGEKFKLEEALPEGFLERVGERGIVVEDWAPQAKILRHSSIGGFVSHCGWSSVIESIKFGVPIIAIPMQLDQPLNARVVEEVDVGMEVKRDRDGKLERIEVATVIREVVMGIIGESIRRRAREMSDSLRKKGEEEIEVVVDELDKLCATRN